MTAFRRTMKVAHVVIESTSSAAKRAVQQVVVHQARALHEGIGDRRADEPEAALAEVGAQPLGERRRHRDLLERGPAIADRCVAGEPPEAPREGAVTAPEREHGARVRHNRLDLSPVPHDLRIVDESLDSGGCEARNTRRIEPSERTPVALTLAQDRPIAKTRLGTGEA